MHVVQVGSLYPEKRTSCEVFFVGLHVGKSLERQKKNLRRRPGKCGGAESPRRRPPRRNRAARPAGLRPMSLPESLNTTRSFLPHCDSKSSKNLLKEVQFVSSQSFPANLERQKSPEASVSMLAAVMKDGDRWLRRRKQLFVFLLKLG